MECLSVLQPAAPFALLAAVGAESGTRNWRSSQRQREREKETSACPMRSSVWLPARLDQTRDRSNLLELSDSWKFVAPCRQRQREVLHNPFQSFPFPDIENSPAPSERLKVHL